MSDDDLGVIKRSQLREVIAAAESCGYDAAVVALGNETIVANQSGDHVTWWHSSAEARLLAVDYLAAVKAEALDATKEDHAVTDIDLNAIRARAQAAGHVTVRDVAALIAELDAANDALADVTRLLDEAREERNAARREANLLTLDAADMLTVVEAAEAWREQFRALHGRVDSDRWALIAAVDAYRAGQKAPADGPAPTVGQDPGEVEAPSADAEQAQRGVQGPTVGLCFDTMTGPILAGGQATYLTCDLPARHAGAHSMMQDGGTRAHWKMHDESPADPPGLDAAIEAARAAAKQPLHEALHSLDVRIPKLTAEGCHCNLVAEVALDETLAPAVRAAAPALRAGALREAADDFDETGYLFRRGNESTWDMFGRWLRERADRIGGAT